MIKHFFYTFILSEPPAKIIPEALKGGNNRLNTIYALKINLSVVKMVVNARMFGVSLSG
jgi:hypothetical protein